MNNQSLISNLKQFMHRLLSKDHAGCKKLAQLFNKSQRRQWGNLTLKCIHYVMNQQQQNRKLKQQNKKYLQLIKIRNQKQDEANKERKLENEIRQKEKLKEKQKLLFLDYLQAGLYQKAYKISTKKYIFLQHLLEYDCLLKIFNGIQDDDKIQEPFIKGQFYCEVKKAIAKNSKTELEFQKYAQKISNGEKLYPMEEPQYLSKQSYLSLLNLQQNLSKPANYNNQKLQKAQFGGWIVRKIRQIYRQILDQQAYPQNVDTITLQNHFQILKKDLSICKQKWNHQNYFKRNQYILQTFSERQSLSFRNSELQKQIRWIQKKIEQILNNQICMDIDFIYPRNQQDTEESLNCLAKNTVILGQYLELYKKQAKQYQTKLNSVQRQVDHGESQIISHQSMRQISTEKQTTKQQKSNFLSLKQQQTDTKKEVYQKQIHDLKIIIQKRQKELQMIKNQGKQKQKKMIERHYRQIQKNRIRYDKLQKDYSDCQQQLSSLQNSFNEVYHQMLEKQKIKSSLIKKKTVLLDSQQIINFQNKKAKINNYQQQINHLKRKIIQLESINHMYTNNQDITASNQLKLNLQIQIETQRYQTELSTGTPHIQSKHI